MFRHALLLHHTLVARINNSVFSHHKLVPVQVVHLKRHPQQGLLQRHALVLYQVVALPLERVVRLLTQHHEHISREPVQSVVALHLLCDGVAVFDPLLHDHLQCLHLVYQFGPVAVSALVLYYPACPPALVALGLILDHALTHVLSGHCDALTLALVAHLAGSIFGAGALADGANGALVELQFELLAGVHVLEGDLELELERLALLELVATPEEAAEEVHLVVLAAVGVEHAEALDALDVIDILGLLVGEDFVGGVDFLELGLEFFGGGVCVGLGLDLVGVLHDGEFFELFLDFFRTGFL